MQTFLSPLLLIVIIVFQHDIRRALTQVGKSPFYRHTDVADKELEEIIRTLFYLAKRRIGALIVIERETSLAILSNRGSNSTLASPKNCLFQSSCRFHRSTMGR